MDYYMNNLDYILNYDKKKNSKIMYVILIIIIILLILISRIKIYSYKEYYAMPISEGEEKYMVSQVSVEDTKDILSSDYIEIDNKKYPIISTTFIIDNTTTLNLNNVSIKIDTEIDLEDNVVIKVKYLYKKETILNKVKNILKS